jgi:hypothetical protein
VRPLSKALALSIAPPTTQSRGKWRFELRNVSAEKYWVPLLPKFDVGTTRGDVILTVEDAAGNALKPACIFHDGEPGTYRVSYVTLSPGKTLQYQNDVGSCFYLSKARPGVLTIRAKFRPRFLTCDPPPAGKKCFTDETETVTAKARLVDGDLVGL